MEQYEGFATLEGIVIFGDGDLEELTSVIVHETRHIEQVEKPG